MSEKRQMIAVESCLNVSEREGIPNKHPLENGIKNTCLCYVKRDDYPVTLDITGFVGIGEKSS